MGDKIRFYECHHPKLGLYLMQTTKYFNIVPQFYYINQISFYYSVLLFIISLNGGGGGGGGAIFEGVCVWGCRIYSLFFLIRLPVCRIIKTIQAYLKQHSAIVQSKISQLKSVVPLLQQFIILNTPAPRPAPPPPPPIKNTEDEEKILPGVGFEPTRTYVHWNLSPTP